jgi:hypothetical protein
MLDDPMQCRYGFSASQEQECVCTAAVQHLKTVQLLLGPLLLCRPAPRETQPVLLSASAAVLLLLLLLLPLLLLPLLLLLLLCRPSRRPSPACLPQPPSVKWKAT